MPSDNTTGAPEAEIPKETPAKKTPARPVDPVIVAAKTAWGEARGLGLRGMWAVLNAIHNRAKMGGWWGDTVAGVCLKPEQFSCWNESDPNRAKMEALEPHSDEAYDIALDLAAMMVKDELPDLTGGADSYYADSIEAPDWVAKARFTEQIGAHRFYVTRV